MFESRISKYLYLPSQTLSHSSLTSLSRQHTIQIWRPKFTATSPGSSLFPNKEAREHSRITWPICAGPPTILDRTKWKIKPSFPPKSRMKPRKNQNAPFSHPWFVGRVGGTNFPSILSKVEALRGALGPTLGRGGKENEGELATTSLEFEFSPPPIERRSRYVTLPW